MYDKIIALQFIYNHRKIQLLTTFYKAFLSINYSPHKDHHIISIPQANFPLMHMLMFKKDCFEKKVLVGTPRKILN